MDHSNPPGRRDPDPVVTGLLINLASAALVGAIAKVGRQVFMGSREFVNGRDYPLVQDLRDSLEELDGIVANAAALVPPATKRELGGVLLLGPEQLRVYHDLREQAFEIVRHMDSIGENLELLSESDPFGAAPTWPPGMKTKLTFIDKRLRAANTAALSGDEFIELKSAIIAMRAMLDSIEEECYS